jgi:hypothetical protein
VLIAIFSLWLSVRSDRREERADVRDERRDQREEMAAALARRGRPVLQPGPLSGGPAANPVHHEYLVRNAGQAAITALWLWIIDGNGVTISSVSGGDMVIGPGEATVWVGLDVRQPLPEEQTLMVRWRDPDGEHEQSTGIAPRRHA